MAEHVYRDAAGLAQAARWALYAGSLACAAAVAVALVQGPVALQYGDLVGPLLHRDFKVGPSVEHLEPMCTIS